MPDPKSDRDQHRFSQIRQRMLEGVARNCSSLVMEASGAKNRAELVVKLAESWHVMELIECCAYEAQCMEEERARGRS